MRWPRVMLAFVVYHGSVKAARQILCTLDVIVINDKIMTMNVINDKIMAMNVINDINNDYERYKNNDYESNNGHTIKTYICLATRRQRAVVGARPTGVQGSSHSHSIITLRC